MELLLRGSWVFGVLGLLLLVVAGSHWTIWGSSATVTWLLVGAGANLVLYGVLDKERLAEGVSSRGFRYGAGSTLLVVLAAGVVVLAYELARRNDQHWDLSREGHFELSEHSVKVARNLEREVRVHAFFRAGGAEDLRFRDLLVAYGQHTDRLEVTYVDPLRQPQLARQFQVEGDHGTVVLQQGDRLERIGPDPTEHTMTQALLRLHAEVDHRLCWAEGHGEGSPDDDGERGYSGVVLHLEGGNYEVTRSRVLAEGIDPGCDALLVVGPRQDWLPGAREALADYVASGGRALVMLQPDATPDLADEMSRFGVSVGDDLVLDVDTESRLQGIDDFSWILVHGEGYALHPITENLRAAVLLPMARSVSPAAREGLDATALLRASPMSWGETGFREMVGDPQGAAPTDGEELVGDVPLMVAVELEEPSGGRLVVIGDADFANNAFAHVGNNRDLFYNAVAWLVDDEQQLGSRPPTESQVLNLTLAQAAVLWLVSTVLVPGAALVLAVLALIRRRFL